MAICEGKVCPGSCSFRLRSVLSDFALFTTFFDGKRLGWGSAKASRKLTSVQAPGHEAQAPPAPPARWPCSLLHHLPLLFHAFPSLKFKAMLCCLVVCQLLEAGGATLPAQGRQNSLSKLIRAAWPHFMKFTMILRSCSTTCAGALVSPPASFLGAPAAGAAAGAAAQAAPIPHAGAPLKKPRTAFNFYSDAVRPGAKEKHPRADQKVLLPASHQRHCAFDPSACAGFACMLRHEARPYALPYRPSAR